jgi:hypothetical protein
VPPNRLPHAVSNWLHVRLTDPSLDLVGLRVPIESSSENRAYWNWFEPAIQRLLASPAVIIGDLNADPRIPGRLGTDQLNGLKQAGWKLPEPEGEWSFIGIGGQTSRLDHALISPSVRFNKAEYFPLVPGYIFASPEGDLSDHAPLVLDISRPSQPRKQYHHHDPTENACWREINVVVHDPADHDTESDATQDRGSSIPMSKQGEAGLILKLYELRREKTMRKARDWYFLNFNPQSIADFTEAMFSDYSGHLRMVVTYWDMAAALVNDGAISLDLFTSTNREHVTVFSKIEPWLGEIRRAFAPQVAVNLEKLIDAIPDGRKQTATARERMKTVRDRLVAREAKVAQQV